MFEHLVEMVREQGHGVRAYEACAQAAGEGMRKQPDLAAAYYLLGAAANHFVELYGDQPLSSEKAAAHLTRYEEFASTLGTAFEGNDDAAKISAVNAVAGKLMDFGR